MTNTLVGARVDNFLDQVLEKFYKKDFDLTIIKDIKSGKEASVYLVQDQEEDMYALKIYNQHQVNAARNEYTAGKYIRERSLRRAIAAKNKVGKELMTKLWTSREFFLLRKFYVLGCAVPQVIEFTDEAILMEYLGNLARPAPRLIDIDLPEKYRATAFGTIMDAIDTFWQVGVVHGDLSAYNVLWWQNQPWM